MNLTRRSLPVLCLLLLWLTGLPGLAEEAATSVRLYDVAALVTPGANQVGDRLGLLTAWRPGYARPEDDEELEAPNAFLEPDALVAVLRLIVPALADDEGASAVEIEGTHLRVEGGRAIQAAVRAALESVWREAACRITTTAHWLGFDEAARRRLEAAGLFDALLGGRPGPDAVAAIIREARSPGCSSSSASTTVRPGHQGVLGQLVGVSYVRDYAVEIAQDSRVGDPVVDQVVEGWNVEVRPFPLQGKAVYLEAFFQAAVLERPVRNRSLEAEPFGTVDLPRCDAVRGGSALRLAPEEVGALVVAPAPGGVALGVLLLEATRRDARSPGSATVVRRLDTGALLSPPLETRIRSHLEPDPLTPQLTYRALGGPPSTGRDRLLEDLLTRTDPSGREPASTWIGLLGDGLWARGDAQIQARVEAAVAEHEDALRPRRLRVRLVHRSPDGAIGEEAIAALDVAPGSRIGWQSGTERAYVADWDVEVAQEARSGDPKVSTAFGGLVLDARLVSAPSSSSAALDLRLAYAALDPEMATLRPQNECTGIVEIPRVRRLDLVQDLVLDAGRPTKIDGGTLSDGSRLEVELLLLPGR